MHELSFSDSQLDGRIRKALQAASEGDVEYYDQIVALIHHKERLVAEDVAVLVTCLKGISGAVRSIHIKHHQSLLAAIFGMSLWDYGIDIMDALLDLLVDLAASTGEYVDLCLEMLVINFMPPTYQPYTSIFTAMLKRPQGLEKKSQVIDRVHSTLTRIINMHPVYSPRRLKKIVIDRMPNIKMREHVFIETYVENMLRLESGKMGELVDSSSILIAIMDGLTDLDVEIDWEDILQNDFPKGVFDLELDNFELHVDHIQSDCDEFDWEAWIQKFNGNEVAKKLDGLMVLVFEHLRSCSEGGRLIQVFRTLLQSFQMTILTAYKSKFCQFIMFYACSLDPGNCGRDFATMLLNIFVDSPITERRMSAVSYLASFLARAKFLEVSFISTMLASVVNWCFIYCKGQVADIDPKAHKVFYAGCQAIMYVLCFRMKQMLSIPRLKSQLLCMHVEDILGHPLQPLQVCLPTIVEEFLRLTRANDILSLPQTFVDHGLLESEHSRAFGGMERLDMFFPFDPCLLMKCDRFIRPNYVYWSMVRSTYEDEGTSDEDDEIDECDDENGSSIPIKGCHRLSDEENCELDQFDVSLDKMSITPRDSSNKFGGRIQRFTQMPSKIRPSTSPASL